MVLQPLKIANNARRVSLEITAGVSTTWILLKTQGKARQSLFNPLSLKHSGAFLVNKFAGCTFVVCRMGAFPHYVVTALKKPWHEVFIEVTHNPFLLNM